MLRDPESRLAGLDPTLARVLSAAAETLPRGWAVELVTPIEPRVSSAGLMLEIRLRDPKGRMLRGETRAQAGATYDAYRHFADRMFRAQYELAPELAGRLAWGGRFTSATGFWQIGRFDLGGERGRGIYRSPAQAKLRGPRTTGPR